MRRERLPEPPSITSRAVPLERPVLELDPVRGDEWILLPLESGGQEIFEKNSQIRARCGPEIETESSTET